jgi:hypothetical protein
VKRAVLLSLVWLLGSATVGARSVRADDDSATAEARSHYEMGLKLFDAREHEQALIEFEKANELKTRPAALFMMAQCEYLLGRLKGARGHYQRYFEQNPDGEFAALARDRVEAIDKRPSTFVINTVPDDVTVRISPDGQTGVVVADGQAPNNFSVPRGRYRIDVTKPSFLGQTRIVDVDIAETKPLFFKLDPIPARLEIETWPPGATLYVNGNRARNPYRQDVAPGPVEIFAEAPDYDPRTVDLVLAPSDRKLLTGSTRFQLSYKQRSGRPELIFASALLGGFVGAGAVAAAIGAQLENPRVAPVLLFAGGGLAGVITGALAATSLVPNYIPDNRALSIIGGMWVGASEGAMAGIIWEQASSSSAGVGDQLQAAFIGSLPGLAIGLTGSALLAQRAPTYGRTALIQSAALGGAIAGGLVQIAIEWNPYGVSSNSSVIDLAPGALIGLNVGLAAGLLGAYLPDQSKYGPSWKRVLLVDLAAGAGALAGGVAGCVADTKNCLTSSPSDTARSSAVLVALVGGAIGALGGLLATRHVDDAPTPPPVAMPIATFAPIRGANGGMVPAFAAMGTF